MKNITDMLLISEQNYLADGFAAVTDASLDQNVPCRASCPSGSITWCINVYHPEDNIEACFGDGVILNATEAAIKLNLPSHFDNPVSALS